MATILGRPDDLSVTDVTRTRDGDDSPGVLIRIDSGTEPAFWLTIELSADEAVRLAAYARGVIKEPPSLE